MSNGRILLIDDDELFRNGVLPEATGLDSQGSMNVLHTRRRFHGYQVIAEARFSENTGMWTSLAARVDAPTSDDAVGRAFSLLADAQADADQLARGLWPHECGAMCGNWRPI